MLKGLPVGTRTIKTPPPIGLTQNGCSESQMDLTELAIRLIFNCKRKVVETWKTLSKRRITETFIRTGDIYCLFYEKANQLLKNDGYVCFITSNKWMRADYGKKLRDYFVTLTQPIQLLDMGPDVFDATVDTNILLFQKIVSNAPTAFVGVSLGADFDRQTNNIAQY